MHCTVSAQRWTGPRGEGNRRLSRTWGSAMEEILERLGGTFGTILQMPAFIDR